MAESREILVSVGHAEGTAGVWCDSAGERWLSGRLEGRGGTLIDDSSAPRIEGVGLDLTVQGGVLPPGAKTAHVIDDAGRRRAATTGGDAWVVVLEQRSHGSSPVLYLDDSGDPVRPPLPPDWRVEPVTDAGESCPVCSAMRWEKIVPTDTGSRGAFELPGGGMEPSPVLACAVCGHEEPVPTFFGVSDAAGDDDWSEVEEDDEAMAPLGRAGAAAALSKVDFPVYAMAGAEPRLTGLGSQGSSVTEVDIAHGTPEDESWLLVSVERGPEMDSEAALARRALETALMDAGEAWPDDMSEAALTLWLHARERDTRRAAASAEMEQLAVSVDGAPVEFRLVRSGRSWAAAARIGDDLGVTLSARGVEPSAVALERVRDLRPLADSW
ncbi:MAG: hypothetical protein QOJ57_105 [Thermoleophilaceae bacterium]|nr:hypothetical protein [Thermoleophilaceae bacterium]